MSTPGEIRGHLGREAVARHLTDGEREGAAREAEAHPRLLRHRHPHRAPSIQGLHHPAGDVHRRLGALHALEGMALGGEAGQGLGGCLVVCPVEEDQRGLALESLQLLHQAARECSRRDHRMGARRECGGLDTVRLGKHERIGGELHAQRQA